MASGRTTKGLFVGGLARTCRNHDCDSGNTKFHGATIVRYEAVEALQGYLKERCDHNDLVLVSRSRLQGVVDVQGMAPRLSNSPRTQVLPLVPNVADRSDMRIDPVGR
jgi:hypothetical protein